MHTVEAALQLVERHACPLAPQRVELPHAAGKVLAENVTSENNSPPYDKSMMDGYAIASADSQSERHVIEEVAAGDVPRHAVTPGTAIRIMTGAPLPEGANAVIPHEVCELIDSRTVRLPPVGVTAGMNILLRGSTVRAGQVVVERGSLLRPLEVAILAEAGRNRVKVVPQPSVAVLPTGNELVPPGVPMRPGQIRNSNGPLLTAAVTDAGGKPIGLGIGRDDLGKLRELVNVGLREDVLLISGGVSAGDFDFVPRVLAELGVQQVFHKVALRPGKPLWFGVSARESHRCLAFGLPGNPVSSFVCFELFVRPALAALSGRGFQGPPRQQARLVANYEPKGDRAAYLPAALTEDGDLTSVTLLDWQGSADLAALAHANALVAVAAKSPPITAGTIVDILRI